AKSFKLGAKLCVVTSVHIEAFGSTAGRMSGRCDVSAVVFEDRQKLLPVRLGSDEAQSSLLGVNQAHRTSSGTGTCRPADRFSSSFLGRVAIDKYAFATTPRLTCDQPLGE